MGVPKLYARRLLEEVMQSEIEAVTGLKLSPVDLAEVISDTPIKLSPSAQQSIYEEEDVVWMFDPKTVKTGDVVILNREPGDNTPIAVGVANAENQNPLDHPEGRRIHNTLFNLEREVRTWKSPRATIVDLPKTNSNQEGDVRLVLDTGQLYRWSTLDEEWHPVGSAANLLDDLKDVIITDPKAGDFIVFDGENWVNQQITFEAEAEDPTKLPLTGGTMAGDIVMPSGTMITLADGPSAATDAVNKGYIDTLFGLIMPSVTLIPTTIVNGDYTATSDDEVILVNASAGPATITLPGSPVVGKTYYIKDMVGVAFTNSITIISDDGDTIDGQPNFVLNINWQAATVVFDGTNWYLV